MVTITEVYNNIAYDSTLKTDWGFSCYIHEKKLLFDTGANGEILIENLDRLRIKATDIEKIVLSHDHWDHNGGLARLLEVNSKPEIYVLKEFSSATIDLIRGYSEPVYISGWTEITDGVYSTGPLGDVISEQSIVIECKDGLAVVTGCAHPHIGSILRFAGAHGKVYAALGGFHSVSSNDIQSLEGLGYISASHCTDNIDAIIERYPETFEKGGVGRVHHL